MPATFRILAIAFIAGVSAATPALADAIDGDWCSDDRKRMSIQGPAIVTPGGHRIAGDYSRHAFSYVVPSGEEGAGATVNIQLLSESHAQSRQGSDSKLRDWRRCRPDVS